MKKIIRKATAIILALEMLCCPVLSGTAAAEELLSSDPGEGEAAVGMEVLMEGDESSADPDGSELFETGVPEDMLSSEDSLPEQEEAGNTSLSGETDPSEDHVSEAGEEPLDGLSLEDGSMAETGEAPGQGTPGAVPAAPSDLLSDGEDGALSSSDLLAGGAAPVASDGERFIGYLPEVSTGSADYGESPEELLNHYIMKELYSGREDLLGQDELAAGQNSELLLYGINRLLYDKLEKEIDKVAKGSLTSTVFTISLADLELEGKTWTAAELGVESLFSDEAAKAMRDQLFDLHLVINSLLSHHPYELYWYDKTAGVKMTGGSFTVSYDQNKGEYVAAFKDAHTISFKVAQEYAASAYELKSGIGSTIQYAKKEAMNIVSKNSRASDLQKLRAYKDEICSRVSYNNAAATQNIAYGNPWQLIWVFDGDPKTNVVCEGYAKAFQYLCDMTTFSGGVSCISVMGTMHWDRGSNGAGNHMWNIVQTGGKNYLVDVTNCDEGTVGADDLLFLKPCSAGNLNDGYTFSCNGVTGSYVYDREMLDLYLPERLIIARENGETEDMPGDIPKIKSTQIYYWETVTHNSAFVYWENCGTAVDGYELSWAQNLLFTENCQTERVTGRDNFYIRGLRSSYCFVRIRTYKEYQDSMIYSRWSVPVQVNLTPPSTTSVPKTVITKLFDAGSGNLGIYWRSLGKTVDGYQIKWGQDPKLRNGVKSASYAGRNNATRSGLTNGRTYYVAIRAYQIKNGRKVYSAWSGIKSIRLSRKLKGTAFTRSSISSGGALTLSWKKVSGVSGYQIQYSENSNFTSAKSLSVQQSKNAAVIKNLKKNKLYYFRIRTYKQLSGKDRYFSGWSSTRKITIRTGR